MMMVLSDRYEIIEQVGAGGMAMVYRAWDRVEKRDVAIKVLRPEFTDDADFVRRFYMEAEAASRMSHPNIVNIYGVGQDGSVRYIAMEYVNGRTLKELIRQTGHIKPQRAIMMTLRILAAVDHAHKCHIIHRDIKPQNILVDTEGNVKVADFGIARATNSDTQTYINGNSVLGSVHYFSPEQASGQVADEKSDLYSVGVVLYEMVTGEVPFNGDNAISVALKHVQEAPRSTRAIEPGVSKGLDEVIMKSLEKDALKRYQTAAEFANDLKRAIAIPRGGFINKPVKKATLLEWLRGIGSSDSFWAKFRRRSLVVACVAALVLLGFGVNALYRYLFVRGAMPDLIGLRMEEAVAAITEDGLTYKLEERTDETVRRGFVLEQTPGVGADVWPDDTVTLLISAGKESVEAPALVGETRSEAARLLDEADLVLGVITLQISDMEPGIVIEQSVDAGAVVKPGDAIDLTVSGETALMPNLAGYTTEEAKNLLISRGFALGAVAEQIGTDQQSGTVITQSVAPDTLQLMGLSVDVVICVEPPLTARAQTTVVIQASETGDEVVCTLVESTGEREIYRAIVKGADQQITLDMDTLEPGKHLVRLYLNGQLAREKEIEFIAEE